MTISSPISLERSRRRLLLVGLGVLALFGYVLPARSAGPTVGDSTCPHGFNDYTAASQACYYGTTMYQTHAFLAGAPYISTASNLEHAKYKLSLFSGSPCTSYLEGGLLGIGPGSGFSYGAYFEWRYPSGAVTRVSSPTAGPWGGGHRLDVFWYQGGTTFGASWDGFRPATPDITVAGLGWGGCITEAGLFVATSAPNQFVRVEADPMHITELASWDAGTGTPHFGWNRQIIDRPCGLVSYFECLNGTYYGSQTWGSGKP